METIVVVFVIEPLIMELIDLVRMIEIYLVVVQQVFGGVYIDIFQGSRNKKFIISALKLSL